MCRLRKIVGLVLVALMVSSGMGFDNLLNYYLDMPSLYVVGGMLLGFIMLSHGFAPIGCGWRALWRSEIIDEARAARAAQALESYRSFCYGASLVGMLIGAIAMLYNMDDPSSIGPSMAVALICPLYGIAFAELFFLPLVSSVLMHTHKEAVGGQSVKARMWIPMIIFFFLSLFFVLLVAMSHISDNCEPRSGAQRVAPLEVAFQESTAVSSAALPEQTWEFSMALLGDSYEKRREIRSYGKLAMAAALKALHRGEDGDAIRDAVRLFYLEKKLDVKPMITRLGRATVLKSRYYDHTMRYPDDAIFTMGPFLLDIEGRSYEISLAGRDLSRSYREDLSYILIDFLTRRSKYLTAEGALDQIEKQLEECVKEVEPTFEGSIVVTRFVKLPLLR